MLPHSRNSQAQAPTSAPASRPPVVDRIPGALLIGVVVVALGLAGFTVARLAEVDRSYQPALTSSHSLGRTLEATRTLLSDDRLGSVESRIARADSQAQRFHRLAAVAARGAKPSAAMRAYDDAFGDYYVAARRAAAGLSMSLDADGSSVEDASLGYSTLRQNLGAGTGAQVAAISAARPATAPIEIAAWLTLALVAGAILLRRTAPVHAEWPVAARPAARDQRAEPGNASATVVDLQEAVARLARQRLAASVAAARVAKRNNERQIELARTWVAPALSIVRDEAPRVEMDVYEHDESADEPRFGGLALVTA